MLRIDDIHAFGVICSNFPPQFPANALQSPRFYAILIPKGGGDVAQTQILTNTEIEK